MKMEENRTQKTGKDSGSLQKRFIISVLAATALFIAGLYFMINQPKNFIVIILLADLVLVMLFVAVNTAIKMSAHQNPAEDERYDNIFKSEKASYLLLKKAYEELSYLVEKADEKKEDDSDKIIISQKATAKAILNKSKDHTNAVLRLNNEILNVINAFQEKSEANARSNQEYQETFTESFNDEVVAKQDRLFIELNNMEASLNNSLLTLSEKVSGFQEEIERLADHIEKMNVDTMDGLTKSLAVLKEQSSLIDEVPAEMIEEAAPDSMKSFAKEEEIPDEVSVENLIHSVLNDNTSEEIVPENEPSETEPAIEPDVPDTNQTMTPDDIEALIAGTLDDIGLDINDLEKDPELPGARELFSLETPIETADEEPVLEEIPIMEEAPLPVKEEKKAGPDLSNPNKMMTPEDIAALLASM